MILYGYFRFVLVFRLLLYTWFTGDTSAGVCDCDVKVYPFIEVRPSHFLCSSTLTVSREDIASYCGAASRSNINCGVTSCGNVGLLHIDGSADVLLAVPLTEVQCHVVQSGQQLGTMMPCSSPNSQLQSPVVCSGVPWFWQLYHVMLPSVYYHTRHDYWGQVAEDIEFHPNNLALTGVARQSSDYGEQLAFWAVDGDRRTHFHGCTHTADDDIDPWWLVDLGGVASISGVMMLNRGDDCADRLTNISVTVGVTEDATRHCGRFDGSATLAQDVLVQCPPGTQGQYVKISGGGHVCAGHDYSPNPILTLCEVEVYGAMFN